MGRKEKRNKEKEERQEAKKSEEKIHPEVKKASAIICALGVAIVLILAALNEAGPAGGEIFAGLSKAFGVGYFLLPIVGFLLAFAFVGPRERPVITVSVIGGVFFILAGLGFIDIISPGKGGFAGALVGTLKIPFGAPASLVITGLTIAASFLVTVNRPVRIPLPRVRKRKEEKNEEEKTEEMEIPVIMPKELELPKEEVEAKKEEREAESKTKKEEPEENLPITEAAFAGGPIRAAALEVKNYVPPPLSLLSSVVERPTIGDLRSNANIIKRTLESFGIPVEMGEINVGPTVTRYTLKPAEGVKVARITALNQDLALALAAHPIRIEAPIPGKSLLGIEVPNKSAAIVRLGSLLLYPEFEKSSPLSFTVGRDVNGDPVFADIAKMPHLLIAGATGSGKSIALHSLIVSLLYKNAPETVRFILVDPKRVELSTYNGIPHLMAPVITENKKAMGALRWVIEEMERRYQIFLEAGARDIGSYNKRKKSGRIPFIVIIIDELADLMASYGREVEGAIIRLAQMARATGIHLVVSTQRPSVEVITGLIKANITARMALQVASQVDSRTILDTAGAEKLLGHGDMLFVTAELSKPKRIQGSYLPDEEVKSVVEFVQTHNESKSEERTKEERTETASSGRAMDWEALDEKKEDEDELYEEAIEMVRTAKKASASLLQRRLRIGYARAARLVDIMEERGVVGRGEGAKPREVLL